MFLLFAVFVGVVYASTTVPSPNSVQTSQTSIVYYSDGKTPMARLGNQNRTDVTLAQVSTAAKDAVLSAENRSFYTDPGISFTGIARAAYNDLTGGSTQGGSTITQQYVKKAFLTSDQSFTRKFKELFLAVKLDNTYSKDEILQNYLNTIYFGRGAYGIEAAANTYFGVHASQLTAEQGAVISVLIRNPTYYDPEAHPEDAKARWGSVLDGMVSQHWLSASDRAAAVYPKVRPKGESSGLGFPAGPQGLVVQRAIDELGAKGYSDDQVRSGGLRITTTVSKSAEDDAINAVKTVMQGQPGNLRQALVAVDPRTGGVVAYYGGPKAVGTGAIDYAEAHRQPGSSMKPYTLATGLEQGISVNAIRNGSSPQTFPDGAKIRNAGHEACAACTLKQAITESLNTVFYGEAYDVNPNKVRQTALAATGIPDSWPSSAGAILGGKKSLSDPATGQTSAAIGIGQYELQPIDQAVGFATFASGGLYRGAHFVAKVTDVSGAILLNDTGEAGKQVMPGDVAHDVTYALTGVAAFSHDSLADGRPSASKTGTQNLAGSTIDNTDSWMVGYTPSISTAVWMGSDRQDAIRNAANRPIYGAGLPGHIWKAFMDSVLAGTPIEPLPTSPIIQGDTDTSPVNAPAPPPAPTTSAAPPIVAAPTTGAPVSSAPSTAPVSTSAPTDSTKSTAHTTASSTKTTTQGGTPGLGGAAPPTGGSGGG
jgi:membrane peptidoglycan carboxypeptidase